MYDEAPAASAEMLLVYGRTPQEVAARLEQELDAFERAAASAQDRWDTLMPHRAWTYAQEAEHIVVVNEGSARIARLLLSDRPLRPVEVPRGQLANGRRLAPEAMLPGPGQPWTALRERHAASREALLTAARQGHETPDRTFPHPFMDDLDALGWLRMAAYHTRHHRRQLEKSVASGTEG
ncbi:DinB family protein [Deinococcus pimensis]|uniref:DinB family protein n=1 Tax=Deinococcus pimensis TaxID=309888 RepID=UPI0004805230|nr:DinB family protein [Deinococcus pimensis]